jgi:hypothetical protein
MRRAGPREQRQVFSMVAKLCWNFEIGVEALGLLYLRDKHPGMLLKPIRQRRRTAFWGAEDEEIGHAM